jgi:hypothetical protein
MAAGDSNRRWFTEMVDVLRDQWHPALSCEELIALAKRLDVMLVQIREERGIKTPMFYCWRCNTKHPQDFSISVRAVILATIRYGIATDQEAKAIEKQWMKYRKQHGLDVCGDAASDTLAAGHHHGSD